MEVKKNDLTKTIKNLFFAWLGFFILSLVLFIYIIVIRGELFNTTSNLLALPFFGSFGLGSISFLLCVFLYCFNEQVKNSEHANRVTVFIKSSLLLLVFPLYYIIKIFATHKMAKPKLLDGRNALLLGTLFIVFPFWLLGYLLVFMGTTKIAGLRYYVTSMDVGGSMAPTLDKDALFRLYPYKNIMYKINPSYAYKLQPGDIISFTNTTIKQLISANGLSDYNFVKRIIALPGDTVEFKAGMVFVNGKALDEPYTLSPNSTYAYAKQLQGKTYGDFLPECKVLTIPNNKIFVLADNRENGDDSRFIGLVDFNDVDAYLPLKDQTQGYMEGSNSINHNAKWRQPNTSLTQEALNRASAFCK